MVQRQLNYVFNANTGVVRDQVIALQIQDQTLHNSYAALRETLKQHPEIVEVSAGQSNPTNIDSASPLRRWEGSEEGQEIKFFRAIVQPGFLDLFDIELIEGRGFTEDRVADLEEGVLINETAMKQLGWDTAVDKSFFLRGRTRVIGVMKDFTFHSFHHAIEPLAFTAESGWWFPYQKIFVKVESDKVSEVLEYMKQTFAEFSPGFPFDYYFLDDAFDQLYQKETVFGTLMSYFTLLALLIACLGLLGLSALIVQNRTKEIGVRKVLGASIANIVFMLNKDFTRLVLFAFVVATPIGYLIFASWLENFAYRITLGWDTFLLAGATAIVLAWLTVSYQSVKAATANPVESLKHE